MEKPKKPGYYWAKSDDKFKWYNVIICIKGEAPYLHYVAWRRGLTDELMHGIDPDGYVFGPEIPVPGETK